MPAKPFRPHQDLIAAADDYERRVQTITGHDTEHDRARDMLTTLAERCRTAATALLSDPTLATEPFDTGQFRIVDLVCELARQLGVLIRNCFNTSFLDRWPAARRWEEAEALYERAILLADRIPHVVPRPDHATVEGSQHISLIRLAAGHTDLQRAVDAIRYVLTDAVTLPHPTLLAWELDVLASALQRHVDTLQVVQDAHGDVIAAALGPATTVER